MNRQEDPYPTFVYLCVRCREEMDDLDMAYAHEVLHYSEPERNLEQRTAVRLKRRADICGESEKGHDCGLVAGHTSSHECYKCGPDGYQWLI